MDLEGKLLLVTGGGAGIGAAVCRLAEKQGARVVIADINGAGAEATLASMAEPSKHLGIEKCTEAVYDRVMAVNMKGTYLLNRKLVLHWKEKGIKGAIVNVSSVGVTGSWAMPAYCASKGAVEAFTRALAKEMGIHGNSMCNTAHYKTGTRLNNVSPGCIDTELGLGGLADPDDAEQRELLLRMQREAKSLMGGIGRPEEVAEVILFLLSEKASYVTASVYEVNGGVIDIPGKTA